MTRERPKGSLDQYRPRAQRTLKRGAESSGAAASSARTQRRPKSMKRGSKGSTYRSLVAILCAIALLRGDTLAYTPHQASPSKPAAQAVKIAPDQMDSLVAPLALYPDPLL